ncbi:hypothetical protein KUCAC02_027133, partial [Chaenocephalus aceratus]
GPGVWLVGAHRPPTLPLALLESAFVSAGPRGLLALTRPKILIRRCKREVKGWGGGKGGKKRGGPGGLSREAER